MLEEEHPEGGQSEERQPKEKQLEESHYLVWVILALMGCCVLRSKKDCDNEGLLLIEVCNCKVSPNGLANLLGLELFRIVMSCFKANQLITNHY